jgi:hypothetical protein
VERGHVMPRRPISLGASPNQEFAVHASMYGKVSLRHGRRLRRASARHRAWFWSLSGLGIGSDDTQLEPVSGPFGVHITPVWPLELIFSGIISVCHSS